MMVIFLADGEAAPDYAEEEEEDEYRREYSIEDFVRAARIDTDGFVSCPLHPHGRYAFVARLQAFPKMAPPEEQAVSVRCYIHGGCKHIMARRWASDRELLAWVFAGQRGNSATAIEMAKQAHAEAWEEFYQNMSARHRSSRQRPPS